MGRLKAALVIFLLLIALCTAALVNTWVTHNKMDSLVEKAMTVSISDEYTDEAKAIKPMLEEIGTYWGKCEKYVSMYSQHDDVQKISEQVNLLLPLYENRRYTQLNIALSEVSASLDHLLESEIPSVENIF